LDKQNTKICSGRMVRTYSLTVKEDK
jgi:hypothetical protein